MDEMRQFDFGENWKNFSTTIGSEELDQAVQSLQDLIGKENIEGKTFLDVGCGSGLFSIAASKLGADRVLGVDINPKCVETAKLNASKFGEEGFDFKIGSILDENVIKELERHDVVYAWGSLHHTGEMYRAIENTVGLVKDGGTIVLAIYNRNITSKTWWYIKMLYNKESKIIKRLMELWYLSCVIPLKFIISPKSFLNRGRGMRLWFDAIDWLGGFPYEYASKEELSSFMSKKGFELIKFVPTYGFTGCNEFVFRKRSGA